MALTWASGSRSSKSNLVEGFSHLDHRSGRHASFSSRSNPAHLVTGFFLGGNIMNAHSSRCARQRCQPSADLIQRFAEPQGAGAVALSILACKQLHAECDHRARAAGRATVEPFFAAERAGGSTGLETLPSRFPAAMGKGVGVRGSSMVGRGGALVDEQIATSSPAMAATRLGSC